MSYIKLKNVCKEFKSGNTTILANDNISFELEKGKLLIIVGASGAGKKTTLLNNIIANMEKASSGDIFIGDQNLIELDYAY